MRVTVEAEVDAEDIIDEISDEKLRELLDKRDRDNAPAACPPVTDAYLLDQIYRTFQMRGDAPPELLEYLWRTIGRVL